MLNTITRSWMLGGWAIAAVAISGLSLTMGASFATTSMLLGLTVAGGILTSVIAQGAPPPTVAEILYSTDTSKTALKP